ncbi:hypothetical protein Tco_1110966 [Tanacetum coccineum]|uniref:CCHC-type domain-containing protein n=1 Tax=Tanacetum coccineum TaxID=301880 RepID=A0ABQ5IMR1_9ASTR
MASFDYRLNPLYTIKECSFCGALYTTDYCCSKGSLVDKIVRDPNKTPDSSQRPPQNCARCGNPVDGPYCRGCALLRKKFKEDLFTYCVENRIFQDLQDTSESSNDNTNIVNAPHEPFIVKQDPGKNSSQSPSHIDHHCCYKCGDSSDDIFCQRCTCESCGKGTHYGYNCPQKVLVISNPEPCNNQTIDELPQTLPSFDPTCYYGDENSFTYDSNHNFVDDSPNPPPQPPTYTYEFCGNDAYYGHDCPPQVPFTYNSEPCYNQDFNFPQNFQSSILEYSHLHDDDDEEERSKIPSESEGIPDNMCDVPFRDNSPPLDISKDQFEGFSDSNDDSTSIDDDSFSIDDIDYVEASPPDSELVSLEVVEIVIPEVGGIDTDILLTIKDDILREKLLNVNLLIAKIEALKDNPTLSFDFVTKSSSTSLNFFLEETNTFDNSSPESETFCFNLEEISSGSPTSYLDLSLPDYEAFFCDSEPDSGDFTMDVVEDIFDNPTREPRVHVPNVLPTYPTLQLDSDFTLSSDSLRSDLVVSFPSRTRNKIFDSGIFIEVQSKRFLSQNEFSILFIRDPLSPVFDTLLPFSSENEDNIFNPGILVSNEEKSPHLLSHRGYKAFQLISESPMMISRGHIPILDVPFLHFYPL